MHIQKRKKRNRPNVLNEILEGRMLKYAMAAGAALGATCAVVPTANAKVEFTPSNAFVDGNLNIDINNDGTPDFVVTRSTFSYGCGPEFLLSASGALPANGLEATAQFQTLAALRGGTLIPNASRPLLNRGFMAGFAITSFYSCRGSSFGPFANTAGRFLGVKFIVDGQAHYGWIGFRRVSYNGAQLMGWAYETEPNTSITTGFAAAFPAPAELRRGEPTNLELLARGHDAVVDWRRRTAATVANPNG